MMFYALAFDKNCSLNFKRNINITDSLSNKTKLFELANEAAIRLIFV